MSSGKLSESFIPIIMYNLIYLEERVANVNLTLIREWGGQILINQEQRL